MACFHPLQAFRTTGGDVVFKEHGNSVLGPVELPCGRCLGCRLERSRQWAVRCVHEAQCWPENSFITLTYSDEHLPPRGSLDYRDFQLFMKRLRKRFPQRIIRYYGGGEYGEKLGRPHFHACLFNRDFFDKTVWKKTDAGEIIYRSAVLEEAWPFGHSSVGEMNFRTAGYCARYILDKRVGQEAESYYRRIDTDTGEIYYLEPEFNFMSLKDYELDGVKWPGGIGARWFLQFQNEVKHFDSVVVNGKEAKPPRYYDKLLEKVDRAQWLENGVKREQDAYRAYLSGESSERRLRVKEQVRQAQADFYKRGLK